jgi:hypothetical protein
MSTWEELSAKKVRRKPKNIAKACLKCHAATKIIMILRREDNAKKSIMRVKRNFFSNNI